VEISSVLIENDLQLYRMANERVCERGI